MSIIRTIEEPFPNDLEGRLANVLNVVNTELKSATLLHLDDQSVEGSAIRKRIQDTVGMDQILPKANVFDDYCSVTLVPMGMVARQEVVYATRENETVGYALTEAGEKYGQLIAAFSLQWAATHEMSLYLALGRTGSRGKSRCPENAIRILKALRAVRKPLRMEDIREVLSWSAGGNINALRNLKNVEFVICDSAGEPNKGRGRVLYEWTGEKRVEEIETVKKRPTLASEVVGHIAQRGLIDAPSLASELRYKYPGIISGILSALERQGAVRRHKWRGKEKFSEIQLTERGIHFIETYLLPIEDALSDGQALKEMRHIEERGTFVYDVRRAIAQYCKVSPRINCRSQEETDELLISNIAQLPYARPYEISERLGLGRSLVTNHLRNLAKEGILKKAVSHDNKRATRYYLE